MKLTPGQIYSQLDPSWWTLSVQNNWDTEFYATTITFNTDALTNCTYDSSAPFQTNGLNAGTDAAVGQVSTFVDHLMQEASQRLAEMGAITITGHSTPKYVFGATQ